MSENTNQFFEQGKAFARMSLGMAKEQVMDGLNPNIALIASRKIPSVAFMPGDIVGPAMSFDGETGEMIAEYETSKEELIEETMRGDFDEENASVVIPVPFMNDKPMWWMTIGMSARVMEAKFISIIADAWTSKEPEKYDRPSDDPNRGEIVNVLTLFFNEEMGLVAAHSLAHEYSRDEDGNPVFEEEIMDNFEQREDDKPLSRLGGPMVDAIVSFLS